MRAESRSPSPRSRGSETVAVPHVLIIHRVADYDAWKAVFDAAAGIRRDAGERHYELLAAEDDPAHIVHYSEWTDLASARAFFESAELVEIRRQAGVHAPTFHYLDELETGTL
ncbi:MAG: antibiotic biosynthesis monooxygenase [Ilumatobacteraceae bacterium]|nr:antibiotic biosynthesis monooxygenase [Ilumatobacteraceae bacterium]